MTIWKNAELPLLYAGIDSDTRKERAMGKFVCPQQGKWYTRYV